MNTEKNTNQKPFYKQIWFWTLIIVSIIIIAIVSNIKPTTDPATEGSVPTITDTDKPQPNTTEMVDYIRQHARDKSKIISENELQKSIDYIESNISDFFRDNETMENIMYNGSLLEYYYDGGKTGADVRGEIGMDAVQAVKYVYRGTETATDQATIENINQVKNGLMKLKK